MFSGLIMLIVLLLFGIVHWSSFLLMPLVWMVVGFFFSSLAIIITSFAPNFDFFTYYLELFITPMFFFSGIFFPLDKMPKIVKSIAHFLPLTYAVEISRAFVRGPHGLNIFRDFAILIIFASFFFIWALYQMKKRLIK